MKSDMGVPTNSVIGTPIFHQLRFTAYRLGDTGVLPSMRMKWNEGEKTPAAAPFGLVSVSPQSEPAARLTASSDTSTP